MTSLFKWKVEYWTSLAASVGGKIYSGILADAGSSLLLTMFLPDNSNKEPTIPELKFEDIIVTKEGEPLINSVYCAVLEYIKMLK